MIGCGSTDPPAVNLKTVSAAFPPAAAGTVRPVIQFILGGGPSLLTDFVAVQLDLDATIYRHHARVRDMTS